MKKNHLIISAVVVIGAAFVYGWNPEKILPQIFDFRVDNLELKNIFRAIMGLYLAFAGYWLIGAFRESHWKYATLSNVIFMGGLAFGRLLSMLIDGWSLQYGIGMILEFLVMLWGVINLKNYTLKTS